MYERLNYINSQLLNFMGNYIYDIRTGKDFFLKEVTKGEKHR